MFKKYDIIVVGAGHAGCEAAMAAGNIGSKVLLVTMSLQNMAQMSCNPSMGGIAKGQIVREIDALGGYSGIISDRTMIQFRLLNRSKGPAMWSPRAQIDRMQFSEEWRRELEKNKNVDFWEDSVTSLIVEGNKKVIGVRTGLGMGIYSRAVILANGTFLNGIIHIGEKQLSGGRIGEPAAEGLTENLVELGFMTNRMKTGTPVRVDARSVDFSVMEEQPGDENPGKFSFTDTPELENQRSCYLTYTNKKVHDILRLGFEKSPMFTGRIKGIGPRYCPSIEDKIERFADKDRHQLFVEPEGRYTIELYINGFSSSLPEDVQYRALREVLGFKNAKIFRPGYAIEYDYFPPTQLYYSLETKFIENLYFAGQINGTTGYEEAAAQGLMAGINAHRKINGLHDFILRRTDAYIGVLIDDLITKGTEEPYRMFTSRAEYRTLLRQDNADLRLTQKGYEIGLAGKERLKRVKEKEKYIESLIKFLSKLSVEPSTVNSYLDKAGSQLIKQKVKLANLVLRPQVNIKPLIDAVSEAGEFIEKLGGFDSESIEEAEILIKYNSYINKEQEMADKLARLEDIKIHDNFDFQKIKSLSIEAREKLGRMCPRTLGQASRISGVSPADISVLLVYLGR